MKKGKGEEDSYPPIATRQSKRWKRGGEHNTILYKSGTICNAGKKKRKGDRLGFFSFRKSSQKKKKKQREM